MKKSRVRVMSAALGLAVIVILGFGPGALAQCGGNSGNMQGQHMGYYGHMNSGQMGMYDTQVPVQSTPNSVIPGYATPAPSPVSGYRGAQNYGGHGQTTGQCGMGSSHDDHKGH